MRVEEEISETLTSPLVDRARGMFDEIRGRAEQAERERRIPVETIESLKESGIMRGIQSKRFGGLELPPEEFYRAILEIAKACGATGWVAAVIGVHAFEAAQLPLETQEEIWADDNDMLVASSYNPTGQVTRAPGGYRINGRWTFSSGCDHAGWVVLGGVVYPDEEGGKPESRHFYLPRSDYKIEDDWFVFGLSGTGSKSIIVDDVFIPQHRTMSGAELANAAGPGMAVTDSPLFKCPRTAVFGGAVTIPGIGAAFGAYDAFVEQTRVRLRRSRQPGTVFAVTGDPYLQLRLSQTAAELDGVWLRILRDYREMYELAVEGKTPPETPVVARARQRLDLVAGLDTSIAATRRLLDIGGATSVQLANPVQRLFRDSQAMRQHGHNHLENAAQAYAQAVLGMTDDV